MGKGDYGISEIYQGGYSSLKPSYGNIFTGYHVSAGSLGLTTDPRNANILQEVSSKLSAGVKHMELEFVSPEVFDSIPKQQLKEVKRISELTGIDVSVHGPVIDTAGINQQGFSELNREASEKKVVQTIERSHELNPKGNISVTFHSAEGIPGTEYKITDDGKKIARLIAINKETGKMAPLEEEKKFYPEMKKLKPEIEQRLEKGLISKEELQKLREKPEGIYKKIPLEKGKYYSPEERLDTLNATEWDNSISQLIFNKERADEILQQNAIQIKHLQEDFKKGNIDPKVGLNPEQQQAYSHFINAHTYLEDTHQHINELFSKAYEHGTEEQKKALKILSENFQKNLPENQDPIQESKAMQELMIGLKQRELAPKMYVPIEEFAVEQSSKTFGNAAFKGWKKFKEKAPILNIENPPAGFALSTGEDLKNLVEASKKQFIEKAINEGLSKSEAKNQADKLIGVTWDVGHINMLRKQGFKEKDIIKETEKIAPLVKHIHLSDNFGFEHTELPMGMGNVPLKKIMEKLGEKGFEATKIIEAGNWWQHFRTSPVQETLEAMGSPIYSMHMAPYWNQSVGLQQDYSAGYGMMLPQVNYETFGAGFAQLPAELGGQRPGAGGGRMSGRGME